MMPRSVVLVLPGLLLAMACGGGGTHLPEAAGGQGEVLVVMSKGHWEGAPGAAVRSILEQPIMGLPQREARFKVAQTTSENFSGLLSVHHSVLYAAIGGEADSTGAGMYRDRHARGQLLVRIAARDPDTWIALMQREGPDAAEQFDEHQRGRVAARLRKERDAAIASSIQAAFGIDLDIPGGYRVVRQEKDFAWLQRDRLMSGGGLEHNVIEGVLIHRHPYTSGSTFTVPYLVELRDVTTRAFVEGPKEGAYMIVQRGFEGLDLMPGGRATRLDGRFAYVMHGLYGMHGAKMGGPFVSLSTIDERDNTLLVVEGFAYAPQFDKREYMRELEALVFSLRFAGDASP